MSRAWQYASVPLLVGGLVLQLGFTAPATSTPPLGNATYHKLSPEVRVAQQRTARLDLQVQLRAPARAKQYEALWTAGARVMERDYAHATARVRLPSRNLLALTALPGVQAVRLDAAPE